MLTEQEKKELKREWLSTAAFFHCLPLKPTPPKLSCVYAFEMGDATIKIGVTQDVEERVKSVSRAKCQDVLRIHSTELAPLNFMRVIEARCHATFEDRRERGEYFAITFEEAVAELDKYAEEIAAAFIAADQQFLDEVTFYFNEFLPEFEKAEPPARLAKLKAEIIECQNRLDAIERAFQRKLEFSTEEKVDKLLEIAKQLHNPDHKGKVLKLAANLLLEGNLFEVV